MTRLPGAHRSVGLGLILAVGLAACEAGPALPEVRKLRVRPAHGDTSATARAVEVHGHGLASTRRHPLRLGLLRESPRSPRVRVDLAAITVVSDRRARAEIPAGTLPGTYRLIVGRGARWREAPHTVTLRAPTENLGWPVLAAVTAHPARPEAGGHLVVDGANLRRAVLVTLHGPLHGRPTPGGDGGAPGPGTFPITELPQPRHPTPTRIVAALPRYLGAGDYYVQVYTESHRGHQTTHTLRLGGSPGDRHLRLAAWAVPTLLLLGLLGWLAGARPRLRRDRYAGALLLALAVLVALVTGVSIA